MRATSDPFSKSRTHDGVQVCPFNGEPVTMILGYRDVRLAAKNWHQFSSDAPFRVPVPSEEHLRTVRQLPIETDPPHHTEYRALVQPFFDRPKKPEYTEKIRTLVAEMVCEAMQHNPVEIVRDFALPLQSRALTHLLNMPECEADVWISWGTNVFLDGESPAKKGAELEAYIHRQLDRATERPGADFFSALTQGTVQGRPLSRKEMVGFANLTFAGGRDTIIHTVSSIIAYLADHPEALDYLREDPKHLITATEEFVRSVSPLTHIGRVCTKDTEVNGHPVKAGERVSLCWASANHDDSVIPQAEEIHLDRTPNPHVGFGSGNHSCLGAPQARLILRSLLHTICQRVDHIERIEAVPHIEDKTGFKRSLGYDRLLVKVVGRRIPPTDK